MLGALFLLGFTPPEPGEIRIDAASVRLPETQGWTRDAADDHTVRLTCASGPAILLLYAYPGGEWERVGKAETIFSAYRESVAGKVVVRDIRRRRDRTIEIESFEVPTEDGTSSVVFVSGIHSRADRTLVGHLTSAPGSEKCRGEKVLRAVLESAAGP